jgi:ER lumen protein retaining receptor
MTESHYRQWIVWLSGVLQTLLYLDFFYYYIRAWRNNQKLSLPS